MTPLRLVVLGFVLIVADLSVRGFDLLPDPAGWAFLLLGVQQLVRRHPSMVVARNAAIVGLVVSLPMVVVGLGPLSDLIVETVLQVTIFFTVCTGLLRASERPEARAVLGAARWYDLGLSVAFVLALLGGLAGPAGLLILIDLGVVAWAMWWIWSISLSPELLAT